MTTLTPMLNVVDIRATIAWYETVGFAVIDTAEDDGELTWAMLGYGEGRVMLNICGREGDGQRRDADLYLQVDDVDAVFARLPDGIDVIEGLHDTFYAMREFIIRDNNGFWLTFGEPVR